jgi:hypothetical protein
MVFKTAFAFAIFSAISASILTLLAGIVGMGVYGALAHFSIVPAVSHFKAWALVPLVLAVFFVSVPIEFLYARRKMFSGVQQTNLKPTLLFFPTAVGVIVCTRVFRWLEMLRETESHT